MKILTAVCILNLGVSFAATSVTQHGITWSFDADYSTGQYANGDYYVVENSPGAGVKVTDITRTNSAIGHDGSMVDPVPDLTMIFFPHSILSTIRSCE